MTGTLPAQKCLNFHKYGGVLTSYKWAHTQTMTPGALGKLQVSSMDLLPSTEVILISTHSSSLLF